MANGSLAKRYARALLNLGLEDGVIDQLNEDLQAFANVLTANEKELFSALCNPILKADELTKVLNAVLDKLGLHNYTNNFIRLLLDKGRLAIFLEIADVYQTMADEKAGRVRAAVQTAREISALERTELRKTLAEASQVSPDNLLVSYEINPDLIGGLIAKVGDTLYDASIRSKLQDIKSTLQ